MKKQRALKPASERFAEKVEKSSSGCWIWRGSKNSDGYGTFGEGGKRGSKVVKAHRFSYSLHVGAIPDGLCVLHRCDTPECVNPEHLFLGTHRENMADMATKGRSLRGRKSKTFGEKAPWSKITEDQAKAIKAMTGRGRDIAAKFGITATTVNCIRRGVLWKHLGQDADAVLT